MHGPGCLHGWLWFQVSFGRFLMLWVWPLASVYSYASYALSFV